MNIEQLKSELEQANAEARASSDKVDRASAQLALAIAESLGLAVGSIVLQRKSQGYGPNQRTIEKRYQVTHIGYSHWRPNCLQLYGKTVKKDGSLGERHEIYGSWELVTASEAA